MSFDVDIALTDSTIQYVEHMIAQMRERLPGAKPKRHVTEPYLRYTVTIQLMVETGHLRVLNEKLVALTKTGEEKDRKPFLELAPHKHRIILRLEGQGHPFERDVGVDNTVVSTPLYAPHFPHITAFKEELRRWRFYYLEPRALMRATNPVREAEYLKPQGEDLAAFYNVLQRKPQHFESIQKAIRLLIPTIERIKVERTEEGLLLLSIFEDGSSYSSRLLSEGTLRVLGLFAILNPLKPATLIAYEEPENGVHPRRLGQLAELFENAVKRTHVQLMINTHSPVLPRYFDTTNDVFVCSKRGRDTQIKPFCAVGPLFEQQCQQCIDDALEDDVNVTDRILRGDYGG
jgi:predicted ATPase